MVDPYAAPAANLQAEMLSDATVEALSPRFWALSGRVGRVQYFTYGTAAVWLSSFLSGLLVALLQPLASKIFADTDIFVLFCYMPILIAIVVYARRRLQDLNQNAWLSLLIITPVLNFLFALYLLFAPGTRGGNTYGLQPKPPSRGLKIAAFMIPVAMIGILLAVAIPAYHDFTRKAQENNRKWQVERQRHADEASSPSSTAPEAR